MQTAQIHPKEKEAYEKLFSHYPQKEAAINVVNRYSGEIARLGCELRVYDLIGEHNTPEKLETGLDLLLTFEFPETYSPKRRDDDVHREGSWENGIRHLEEIN